MTNIVLIARDRPRLTIQALHSIRRHTVRDQFTLTVVDDGSIEPLNIASVNEVTLRLSKPSGRVGFVKNLGAWFSERYWGRGAFLCFLDNDVYCKPQWLDSLVLALTLSERKPCPNKIIGGYRHPYHGVNAEQHFPSSVRIEETDAVAGYCHFMRWETFDSYGPYASNAAGIGQSEDFEICRKVIESGASVGYVFPPCISHCGITNSNGDKATGHESFEKVPGILYL